MAQNNNGDVILTRRVGDFLRRELKNRRMQQYKFAMDFGCGERTVNRWINEMYNKSTSGGEALIDGKIFTFLK